MAQRIVFNSSMPRSGSTLLQNILAQNPRFYCSPTSGVFDLLFLSRSHFSELPMFKAQDPDLMKTGFLGFCGGALRGFYSSITDRPICFDKSRGWISNYDFLKQFEPEPKLLICVRDLRAILSSMEKLYRKNKHLAATDDNHATMNMVTIQARVLHWLNAAPVGATLRRLVDAIELGNHRHAHVVRFEDLTQNPRETMKKVYEYLGEDAFGHDFENVKQQTSEDDSQYPIYGNHKIRERVEPVPLDYVQVLGRDLADAVRKDNSVYYRTFYPDLR